eukprot:1490858-Pyramimonas_sp.AAC.1
MPAGNSAMTFGYLPTNQKGRAPDGKCDPIISEATSNHKLPPVTNADSCTWVQYDYYTAEGIAPNIPDITGSAHSRVIQYLRSTKPHAGFDEDRTKFK